MDYESRNFRKSLWQYESPLTPIYQNSLPILVYRARQNHEFTDFAFICGAARFPVHKVVVCSQSKVFHIACTGLFKESSTNEYDLSESSVDHVKWLVDFLYMGTYHMEFSKDSTLADHIYMFALGDMYSIEPLAQYAAEQFRIGISHAQKLEDVLPLIPQVYNSTPEHRQELREQVVKFMRCPVRGKKEAIESREWFDDMAEQCPDFIKDLLFSYLEWPDPPQVFW